MDICTHLREPNHLSFGPGRCKQTIARPAIGKIDLSSSDKDQKMISFRTCDRWCTVSCYWNCLYW